MMRKMEVAAALVLALTATAVAQQRDPARPPTQPGGAVQGSPQQLDTVIANCLLLGNQAEISICQYAIEKIESDDVKEQAKAMIEDHEKYVAKLRKYASRDQSFELRSGREGKSGIRQVGGTDADRDAPRNPATGAPATGTTARPAGDIFGRLFAIELQATNECLKLTEECLNKHEGKDFDQAFLGQQIGAHIHMMAKLKAAENNVSPEFRELIREGQKTAKDHKEHAEKLMEKLAKK